MPRTIFCHGSLPRTAWSIGPASWSGNDTYYALPFQAGTCPGTIDITCGGGTATVKRVALGGGEIIIQVVGPFGSFTVVVPADPGGYPIVAISVAGGLGNHVGASDPGCPP